MRILDLFAGTGVGVAAARLGIEEYGVEVWEPAFRTREAVGFKTSYRDAWDISNAESLDFNALWASPPCQTFSVAGKGAGRKALDDVLAGVREMRWTSIESLRELGDEVGDARTALVLTPLAYIHRYRPEFVALEQVPTVLPVWNAYVGHLEAMGYSAWTGYLHAEQYGVPQTRKRAYLIARLDGGARPPRPTHSKYYPRDPKRLDPGVRKWVSMADALGWGIGDAPSPTLTSHLGVTRSPTGTQGVYLDAIERGGFRFKNVVPAPSKIATSGIGSIYAPNTVNVDTEEGGRLQSYPEWAFNRPATTIVGSFRPEVVAAPGYRTKGDPSCQNAPGSYASTVDERTKLMSYTAPFPFQGNKSEVSLQIGNAVPPLVASAVLETFLS